MSRFRLPTPRELRVSLTTALITALSLGCQTQPTRPATAAVAPQDADKLLIVDCLLPGQVRKLGSAMTYLSARRPIRTTAVDCEIRGGEYTAFDRADYRTALNVWLPQAKEGDADAQNYVGEIYEKGLGIQPDYKTAAHWYRLAAAQGDSRAQINLGFLYEKGLGVNKDLSEALNWYRKASGIQEDELEFASSVEVAAREIARQEVDAARAENRQLRQELDRTRAQLERRKGDLNAAERELERLRRQLESGAAGGAPLSAEETQRYLHELEQQQAKVDEQRRQIARLESDLQREKSAVAGSREAARTREQQLAGDLDRRDQELAELRARLDRSAQALSSTRDSGLSQAAELDRLKTEIARLKAERQDAKVASLEDELNAKERARALQQKRILELEREVADYSRKLAAARQAGAAPEVADVGPSIEILDPPISLTRGIPSVKLRSAASSRLVVGKVAAPAGLLSFTVNDDRQSVDDSGVFKAEVAIKSSDTPVKMVAIDRKGRRATLEFLIIPQLRVAQRPEAISKPSIQGPTRDTLGQGMKFGTYYALIISNDKYANFPPLETPNNDARRVERVLREKYGFETVMLTNASRYEILSALNTLRERLSEQDNLLIYYAGHGELDRVNDRGHWLPVDAERSNTANWVSNTDITDIINAMAVKHVMVVADSCYSGSMTRSSIARMDVGMSYKAKRRWLEIMSLARSRTVLTSGGLQPVLDRGDGNHSIFADAFLDALENNVSILEGYSLYRQISGQVEQTAARYGIEQVPQYAPIKHGGHEAGEFFFVPKQYL